MADQDTHALARVAVEAAVDQLIAALIAVGAKRAMAEGIRVAAVNTRAAAVLVPAARTEALQVAVVWETFANLLTVLDNQEGSAD